MITPQSMFSSLRGRIFLASALLAVLSIGVAIYLVNVRVTREAEATLQREMVATSALVDQLRTTRAQTFAQMARLIADAPKVKGWLATYSLGNAEAGPGVALASAFRWDTGVQAHAANDFLELTGSLTTGTLSNPRFRDDNSGRQVAGRIELHPFAGVVVGVSGAHGPFVSRAAARAAAVPDEADGGSFAQTAWGSDVEYSHGYYLVRVEALFSQWNIPTIDDPLQSLATSVEGRYKIRPGFYVAGRIDHLGFSEVAGSNGPTRWDAPVTRVEAGGGYSIERNLLLKISAQYDRRDGGRTRRASLLAGQLVYWF